MEELGGESKRVGTVIIAWRGLGDKGIEGDELVETEGST